MILVTGATGFVGSHLMAELLKRGIKVRAARRSGSKTDQAYEIMRYYSVDPEILTGSLEWVEADLLDPVDVEMAIDGIEIVYHTAATVSFDPGDRKKMIRHNTEITRNLVNACLEKSIEKFIYVSSTATLGTAIEDEEVKEDTPWMEDEQGSAYSRSKIKSEMEVWRGIAEGLNAVIVNPSIIIGFGDWNRSSQKLFKAVWDGLKYYVDGVTGYVDIKDVVRSMIELAQSGISGERFIISSENLSYREVFQMIANALNKPPPSKLATPFLLGMAWRVDWLASKLYGKERSITRDIARTGRHKKYFSSKKIIETTGIQFIPVAKSIEDTASEILKARQTN